MNNTVRKLRKLFRNPRLFIYDSKFFTPVTNQIVKEVVYDAEKPALLQDNLAINIKENKVITNKLVSVADNVKQNTVPWVIDLIEGKIKFKSIKPIRPELCTLFEISEESEFYKSVHDEFSSGVFKGSIFTVSGDLTDTFQEYITQYKPFTSEWFDQVKCVVTFDGVQSFADIVAATKYDVLKVNVITNTNLINDDLHQYDLIVSFVDVDSSGSLSRVEIVKSMPELESILLDSLLQIEYKRNNNHELISLFDSSVLESDGSADVVLHVKDEVGSFNSFEEYLNKLVSADSIKNIFASEFIISKYSSFIFNDDLSGMIKKSLVDGVRYNVI